MVGGGRDQVVDQFSHQDTNYHPTIKLETRLDFFGGFLFEIYKLFIGFVKKNHKKGKIR